MGSTNTQFSIAVHLMAGLGVRGNGVTSGELSGSVNTSASFVRRIMAKLSKAGLVRTSSGKSGSCGLAKTPDQVTLYEIYKAVEAPKIFAIHEYPSKKTCWVSCGIKTSLENVLDKTTEAVEKSLKNITLADVISGMDKH